MSYEITPGCPGPELTPEHSIGTTGHALDPEGVNHPTHYNLHPSGVETISITRWMPSNIANAVKYVMRRGDKGTPVKDLKKALWYLEDELKNVFPHGSAMRASSDYPVHGAPHMETLLRSETNVYAHFFYQKVHDYCMRGPEKSPRQVESLSSAMEHVRGLLAECRGS